MIMRDSKQMQTMLQVIQLASGALTGFDNLPVPNELLFDISLTDSSDVVKAAEKLKHRLTAEFVRRCSKPYSRRLH